MIITRGVSVFICIKRLPTLNVNYSLSLETLAECLALSGVLVVVRWKECLFTN